MAIYFQGAGGALVIIFRDLGSKLIVLGIRGALQKCIKNLTLKENPSFRLIFFKSSASGGKPPPQTPQRKYKCLYFRANMLIWIGTGDLYGESFLLFWKIILKIVDFRSIITYFGVFRMRQFTSF